jgi:PST family polysaccharide transporter
MYLCIEKVQQTFCLAAGRVGRLAALSWAEVLLAAGAIAIAAPYGLTVVTAAFVAVFLIIWPLKFANLANIAEQPTLVLAQLHFAPLALTAVMAAAVLGVARSLGDWSQLVVLLLGTMIGVVIYVLLTLLFQRDRLRLLMLMIRPQAALPGAGATPDKIEG